MLPPLAPSPVKSDVAPTKCPACGASALTTASKTITESTYWRCEGCGEIWNVGRRREPARRNDYWR